MIAWGSASERRAPLTSQCRVNAVFRELVPTMSASIMSTVYVWHQLRPMEDGQLRTLFVPMSAALAACWIESEGDDPTSDI